MRSFSRGAVATIALWKSAPMAETWIQGRDGEQLAVVLAKSCDATQAGNRQTERETGEIASS